MNRNGYHALWAAAIAALFFHSPAQAGPYTVTDLGGLGGTGSFVNALNNQGQAAGSAFNGGAQSNLDAVLYDGQTAKALPTLGGVYSIGTGINDAGQVVGTSTKSGSDTSTLRAFISDGGAPKDLGTLGGPYSVAQGINNNGQVVGFSAVAGGTSHAFLYQNGAMTDLGTLGGAFSTANAINNSGQITGSSYLKYDSARPYEGQHAFLYQNGAMTDLGTLNHASDSSAKAINNAGQIVGQSGGHAFLYQNGVMTDLGTLGGVSSIANSVNSAGQVVGTYFTSNPPDVAKAIDGLPGPIIDDDRISHAFLYQDGVMTDLNALLPPGVPWTLTAASAINDRGQIAVTATDGNGNTHALLLTPQSVPEPSTLAVFGLGLACWVGRKRRAAR